MLQNEKQPSPISECALLTFINVWYLPRSSHPLGQYQCHNQRAPKHSWSDQRILVPAFSEQVKAGVDPECALPAIFVGKENSCGDVETDIDPRNDQRRSKTANSVRCRYLRHLLAE